MGGFKRMASGVKVALLSALVVASFLLTSLAWRHIETSDAARVLTGAIILVGMYMLMILELVNRNLAALLGAALAIAAHDCLLEHVAMEEIVGWVDLETLSLLLGMMIMVNVLSSSGIFELLAVWSYKQSGGRFWLLVFSMSIITAFLSAFIDNVSTMLLISPTLIKLAQLEHIDPRYLLVIMVVFCNIGGCATPIGDPPNLIVIGDPLTGSLGITFNSFVAYCGPCVLLTMLITMLYLKLLYKSKESFRLQQQQQQQQQQQHQPLSPNSISGHAQCVAESGRLPAAGVASDLREKTIEELAGRLKSLQSAIGSNQLLEVDMSSLEVRRGSRLDAAELKQLELEYRIKSKPILAMSLLVLAACVLLFFIQSLPNTRMTLGWISLFSALLLLVASSTLKLKTSSKEHSASESGELNSQEHNESHEDNFEWAIGQVEWSTLIFFFALFIVMEVMAKLGLIQFLGNQIVALTQLVPDGQLRQLAAISIILWSSALASATIDNVPFTSMMIKVLASMTFEAQQTSKSLVFALVFGACYGGNGTLIGASANLVTAGVAARRNHPISFNFFFKFAAPITLLSLIVANIYLAVVFVVLGL